MDTDVDDDAMPELAAAGGPTLACQWDNEDLEKLGLWRLDLTLSA